MAKSRLLTDLFRFAGFRPYATTRAVFGDPKARDRAVESWLRQEVAPVYDAMKANPARAVSVDQVRAALAAEYKKATAKA